MANRGQPPLQFQAVHSGHLQIKDQAGDFAHIGKI